MHVWCERSGPSRQPYHARGNFHHSWVEPTCHQMSNTTNTLGHVNYVIYNNTCLMTSFLGQPRCWKAKIILSGSGISWTICKSFAPCSWNITVPALHHSIFTGRMLLLTANQQCQSTESNELYDTITEKIAQSYYVTSVIYHSKS